MNLNLSQDRGYNHRITYKYVNRTQKFGRPGNIWELSGVIIPRGWDIAIGQVSVSESGACPAGGKGFGMDDKGKRAEARVLGAGPMGEHHLTGGPREHSLHIINREQVTIQGVLSVDSFDDEEIILETDMGTLTLRGEELHIKQLDLESGKFAVDGFIMTCLYSTPRQRPGSRPIKGRSILERLFK